MQAVTLDDLSFLLFPAHADPRLARFLMKTVPDAVERADLVLADSENTREEIIVYLGVEPERLAVVYGGVSREFRPQAPEPVREVRDRYGLPEEYLLTVGRIEPRKNLPVLFEAYRLLRERGGIDLPLVVAGGRGWQVEGIMHALDLAGAGDSAVFLGHVPDRDLPGLLAGASLFVFPSVYEGFGLPPLEAMACGTPVIASNAACLPEVLGDAALLVSPRDSEAMADTMARVLKDGDLRRELRDRGLKHASRFTWDASARQLLEAYQRVLTPPTRVHAP